MSVEGSPPAGPPGQTPGREHRAEGPRCPDRIPCALEACSPWWGGGGGRFWKPPAPLEDPPSPRLMVGGVLWTPLQGRSLGFPHFLAGGSPHLPILGTPPWLPVEGIHGIPPWLATMPPGSAQELNLRTPSWLLAAILPPYKLFQKGTPGCNPPTTLQRGRQDPQRRLDKGHGTPPPAPGPPPWPCTRLWAAAVVLSHPRCHPHVSPRVMLQAWVSELSQAGGS